MSKDLIAFLRARLDEDEQVARNTSDAPWVRRIGYISGGPTGATRVTQQAQAWNADHIVRHDPARVLREVEAKRRILDETVSVLDQMELQIDGEWGTGSGPLEESDRLLRLLALPYSDHDDYREEWRP